jgi:hypothetical protein
VTQHADAVEVRAGDRQPARASADRDRQARELEALAGLAGGDPGAGGGRVQFDVDDLGAQPQVDALLVVPLRRAELQRLGVGLAREESYGQRGALVGRLQLAAGQHDRVLVAELAQRGRELEPRLAGADDERSGTGHATSLKWTIGPTILGPEGRDQLCPRVVAVGPAPCPTPASGPRRLDW